MSVRLGCRFYLFLCVCKMCIRDRYHSEKIQVKGNSVNLIKPYFGKIIFMIVNETVILKPNYSSYSTELLIS